MLKLLLLLAEMLRKGDTMSTAGMLTVDGAGVERRPGLEMLTEVTAATTNGDDDDDDDDGGEDGEEAELGGEACL